jgi:hypothetical protein
MDAGRAPQGPSHLPFRGHHRRESEGVCAKFNRMNEGDGSVTVHSEGITLVCAEGGAGAGMLVAHVAGRFKNMIIIYPVDISELDPCVSRSSHILFRPQQFRCDTSTTRWRQWEERLVRSRSVPHPSGIPNTRVRSVSMSSHSLDSTPVRRPGFGLSPNSGAVP